MVRYPPACVNLIFITFSVVLHREDNAEDVVRGASLFPKVTCQPSPPVLLSSSADKCDTTPPVWSKYSNSPFHERLRFYHSRCLGLSSASLVPILSVNSDG